MYNLRTELIKSTMNSLKIDNNAFNQQIISDKIQHIGDGQLQEFYGKLFNASHQYLNGLDRVAKVAEQFKPQQIDTSEIKAKELIELVKAMNNQVFRDSEKHNMTFEDLMQVVNFPTLSKEDEAILNAVKPYSDYKQLIINIRLYATSLEQLKAFKNAIEYSSSYSAIECTRVKGLMG